jgi:hypothetical protein
LLCSKHFNDESEEDFVNWDNLLWVKKSCFITYFIYRIIIKLKCYAS